MLTNLIVKVILQCTHVSNRYMYTLHVYNVIYQLRLNKAKKHLKKNKVSIIQEIWVSVSLKTSGNMATLACHF